MFGGIGGFDLAFQRQGWKGVWYNDWDKYAVKTYNKNFGTNYEPTDITTIDPNIIPEHSLICAGFPCQSFSIAGKRGGFSDTRGTMFFEIMRIAKHQRTPYLLLENVKGLLSHDNGWTFATILNTLDELGYDAEWQVLNSKFFGVPQNRERVFIIANLRTNSRPEVFPITKNAGTISEIFEREENDIMIYDRKGFDSRTKGFRESIEVPTLSVKMGTGGNNVPMVMDFRKDEGFRERDNVSPALTSHGSSQGGIPVPMILDPGTVRRGEFGDGIHNNETGTLNSSSGRENGQEFEPNSESNSLTNVQKDNLVYAPMDIANCLTPDGYLMDGKRKRVNGNAVLTSVHERRLRRLTPIECARLQGFPDDWHVGMSDTQAYKQYGNSVTVNVVEEIAKRLNEWIGN